ncbi:MAG: hypothetical protein KKC76_08825 [Proteobacteria bacterium]|nr:hypothetical protein [Pseudomonadota bacterium]MBU4294909.1 hypothetical protein [Pseudomonadota bacterium]MCG2747335.1 hypothetical protein [Desulfobulbaceae bacterium]
MQLRNLFIEKWHRCKDHRYPVMLIIPSLPGLFPDTLIEDFAGLVEGKSIDFAARYQGVLETFLTWGGVQVELRSLSLLTPIVVSNLEPFYSKWPPAERLDFLRYILRTESANGIVIILYCQENLAEIRSIDENSRGTIWAPA